MRNFLIIGFLFLLLIPGCRSSMDETQLKDYMLKEKNGIKKSREVDNYLFSVYVRPSELFAAQELKAHTKPGDSLISTINERYRKNLYFMLEISRAGKGVLQEVKSTPEYTELLTQLAFSMQDKVKIVTDKGQEISPVDSQLGQYYGMELATNVLFVFPAEKIMSSKSFQFVIDNFGLTTGRITFEFATKYIKRIPELKF